MSRIEILQEKLEQAKERAAYAGMMNTSGLSEEDLARVNAKYQIAMDDWYNAENNVRLELQPTLADALNRRRR